MIMHKYKNNLIIKPKPKHILIYFKARDHISSKILYTTTEIFNNH